MRTVAFVACALVVLAVGWLSLVQGQCGGGAPNPEMKKMMAPMKDATVSLVDAGQKLGEKKPDAKEAKTFETNAKKLGMMNKHLYSMLTDNMCKAESQKLNKGVGDLIKCAGKKDSNGIADGISQIRATCGSCKTCPGL
jgi:hypothetical protein